MKIIGIIGGFSPEATARFYLKLDALSRQEGLLTQPHVLVWNVPVTFAMERRLLVEEDGLNEIRPFLVETARQLERAGADLIVLPCNTLHILSGDIRKNIQVPFVDIIETAIHHLATLHVPRVGLLGTSLTLRSNLFGRIHSLSIVKPGPALQRRMSTEIHRSIITHDFDRLRILLQEALEEFRGQKITDVLLACTDFSGICPTISGINLHDTLTILADEVMRKTSKSYFCTTSKRGGVSPW